MSSSDMTWRMALSAIAILAATATAAAPACAEPDDTDAPGVKATPIAGSASSGAKPSDTGIDAFLDRLMLAESGGRNTAKNPRSSATGPFQFIETTFIEVVRRNFHDETAAFTDDELLAKRTDRDFSRRVAEAFTRENAAALRTAGHSATYGNLRLAFLLGADGAVSVLAAKPTSSLTTILGARVIKANPFMAAMDAAALIRRAERDIGLQGQAARFAASGLATPPQRKPPQIKVITVKCDLVFVACRNWLAIERRKYEHAKIVYSSGQVVMVGGTPAEAAAVLKAGTPSNPPAATAPAAARCPVSLASCRRFRALKRPASAARRQPRAARAARQATR